jgi:hypothetical protein
MVTATPIPITTDFTQIYGMKKITDRNNVAHISVSATILVLTGIIFLS